MSKQTAVGRRRRDWTLIPPSRRSSHGREIWTRSGSRTSTPRSSTRPPTPRRARARPFASTRRRANLLDLYRDRSDRAGRPVLVYLHPLRGSKRLGARYLFHRLAARGWVCVSANYRLGSGAGFAASLHDVREVIDWIRAHAGEYGADPNAVFLAGSSLGGHLASLAALMPDARPGEPDFASAGNPAAGVISLYGYYGRVEPDGPASSRLGYATAGAPPYFVAHGDSDTVVIVDDARGFVEQLRATSSNPVVYADLPGARHGCDLFRSRRFDTVVDAIEAFTACVRA